MNLENDPIAFKVEMQMKALENKGVRLYDGDYNCVYEAFYNLYRELSKEENKTWADKLYNELKHIYDSYSDSWTNFQDKQTDDLLYEYQTSFEPATKALK